MWDDLEVTLSWLHLHFSDIPSTLPSSVSQLPFSSPFPSCLLCSSKNDKCFQASLHILYAPKEEYWSLPVVTVDEKRNLNSFLEVPTAVSSHPTRQTGSHACPEDPGGLQWDELNYWSQSELPLEMRRKWPPLQERGSQPRKELLSTPRSGCYFWEKMEKWRLGNHLPRWFLFL